MANITVDEMKGSEYHRIVAAVLEVMEKALTEPQKDASIQESGEPDNWKMTFQKTNTSLEELNAIKNELGQNFKVTLSPRDKSSLTICIMAPSDDVIALLQKKPAPATYHRTMFDNTNGGGDANGDKN